MQTTFTKVGEHLLQIRIASEDSIEKIFLAPSQVQAHLTQASEQVDLMTEALAACADLGITDPQ